MSNHPSSVPDQQPFQGANAVDEKIAAENIQHREFISRQQRAKQTRSQQLLGVLDRHRFVTAGLAILVLVTIAAIPSVLHKDKDSHTTPSVGVTSNTEDSGDYVIDQESYDTSGQDSQTPEQAGNETNSGTGNTSSTPSASAPSTPAGLRVAPGPTNATIQWGSVSGATQYDIQIARSSSMVNSRQETSGINHAVVFGLESSTVYYARVRSVGPLAVSAWSSPTRFTTTDVTHQVQVTPFPGSVSGLKGTINSTNSITLSWSAASHAQRYVVVRAANASLTSGKKEYSSIEGTKYTIADLQAGTVYYFAVRAVNVRGNGPISQAVAYKTKLSTPSIKGLALLSSNGIRATYTKTTGASKYQVRAATNSSFSGAKIQTSSQQSLVFSSLKPLTKYYFQVRAADASHTTHWSSTRSLKTAVGPRKTLTATFSFQNLGRENVSPTNVFQKIKNSLGGRSNVVYGFAEIDASDPYDEHAALKKVFGTQGWSWFTSDQPQLARLTTSWKSDGTDIVKLLDGGSTFRAHGCATGSEHLMISKYIHRENSKTKFAVINTHFITHAYSSSTNAWCRGYWDRSWVKLRDKVQSLTDRGYDTIITGDFNHSSSSFPFLHANARLIFKSGPDVIFAIPTKGRSLGVEAKGAITTPTGEPFHKDIWAKLTFKGR